MQEKDLTFGGLFEHTCGPVTLLKRAKPECIGDAMDAKVIIEEFQDYLAPRLDTYEQSIYLYILRHGRLQGKAEVTIGFKSARKKMALGIGEKGKPMSEGTCYEKLRSLESKGCLRIIGTEREGTKMQLCLPSEIEGLIPSEEVASVLSLEEMDFFDIPENRVRILERERRKCFYCLRALDPSNHVIEHVTSRPAGNNSYRNVVAACLGCNNKKGNSLVDDFVRGLYRTGYLSERDFESRLEALRLLRDGELKPKIS
jgi:hypothetical protein